MKDDSYYHVPVWMQIAIYHLTQSKAIDWLKNSGQETSGEYIFQAAYGKDSGREPRLHVWNTFPKRVQEILWPILPENPEALIEMAEEYSRERADRETTKVHNGIIELLISKAVKLLAPQPVTIKGNFKLIGRLPKDGHLCIDGNVTTIEGSVGACLEITGELPKNLFGVAATKLSDGGWKFTDVQVLISSTRIMDEVICK